MVATDPITPVLEAIAAARLCWDFAPEGSRIELLADAAIDRAFDRLAETIPATPAGLLTLVELAEAESLDPERTLDLVAAGLRRMASA